MPQRVSTLLFALLGVLALSAAASAWAGLRGLERGAAAMQGLRDQAVSTMVHLKAISDAYAVSIVDASHKVRNGGFTRQEGEAALADANRVIAAAWAAVQSAARAGGLAPAALAGLPAAEARKAEADRLQAELATAIRTSDSAALDRLVRERLYPVIDPLTEAIGRMLDEQIAAANTIADAAVTEAGSARSLMLAFQALVFVVLAGAAWVVRVRVTRPLARLTRATAEIAGGRLDAAVPDPKRRDEIGEMAEALLVFRNNAREAETLREAQRGAAAAHDAARREALRAMAERVEREARSAVDAVGAQMRDVVAAVAEMGEAARRVASEAEAVQAASAEALGSTQTVAAAAEELAATISEITGRVGEANGAAQRAVSGTEEGAGRIAGLQEAVGSIGDVARTIGGIAAQTNLLALNATIEAARAGEAGKGFAVVAGEVKALANQTARSTEEIGAMIAKVGQATADAVESVRGIGAAIGAVDRAGGAVAEAMEQQNLATREIAQAVAVAASSVRDVAGRIGSVAAETRRSGEGAARAQQAAAAAEAAVAELRHAVVRVVRTATSEVDRRGEERTPLSMTGHLSSDGTARHAVEVIDLSPGGAAVRGPVPGLAAGRSVTLELGGARLRAEVAAIEPDGRTRLLFPRPDTAEAATIERLLAQPERTSRAA